ncbi:MAG: ATP-binding cassette domain-containing protein [Acidimicrobiales bacterium]
MSTEPTTLHVAGLRKTFSRNGAIHTVFDDLQLSIAAGEFVSILGPSGCGKSTLLRLVGGLLEADAGDITINGETPTEARDRKHFGFVPQTPALLPWKTVTENVGFLQSLRSTGGPDRTSVAQTISDVGLTPVASSLPAELSGGMQQRVSLARAFALRPPMLLMDEPFSALDEITRSDMRYLLLNLWRDTEATVLFVTHNIDEAVVLSDRVVVLGAAGRHCRRRSDRTRSTPHARHRRFKRIPPLRGRASSRPVPGRRSPMISLRDRLIPLSGIALFFGIWELYVRVFDVRPIVLPRPSLVVGEVVTNVDFYAGHALVSLGEATGGLIIALVLASLVATLMVMSSTIERAGWPVPS